MLVYHSSKTSGLKILEPRKSTHGKPWVYALKDKAASVVFIGDNSDFICQTSRLNGQIIITERFPGALEHAYQDVSGSIYTLDGRNFLEGQINRSSELVSEYPEAVLHEDKVDNVLDYLLGLERKGDLKIFRYPDHPDFIPDDKSDLVDRAVEWTLEGSQDVLKDVGRYHPDILNRVLEILKKKGWTPQDSMPPTGSEK